MPSRRRVSDRQRKSSTMRSPIPKSRKPCRWRWLQGASSTSLVTPPGHPSSDAVRLSRCLPFQMMAVPELEHDKEPEKIAEEGLVVSIHEPEKLFDKRSLEITPLIGTRVEEDFFGHSAQFRVRAKPKTDWETKAVFLFSQNLSWHQLPRVLLDH